MQFCRLVEELPRKAELVGEGANWVAIAERVGVPLPRHRAAGVRDLMRGAEMIRRDIELPEQRERRDRQIAESITLLVNTHSAVRALIGDELSRWSYFV
jgi:hypothetical protein